MADSEHGHRITPERIAAERTVLARRVHRLTGELTTAATARMDEALPWFRALRAQDRAAVSELAQLGITTFVDWFTSDGQRHDSASDIFSRAPRELARALTLQQTVELVRTTLLVVEESVAFIAGDNIGRQTQLREALLRYSSEVAFAAAEAYARAAESRGAWDARLQDLVLDAIITGDDFETINSRASASGWDSTRSIIVLVGPVPSSQVAMEIHMEQIRRTATSHGLDAMVGVHSDRMVTVLGGAGATADTNAELKAFAGHFGPGTIVASPISPNLSQATQAMSIALSGYRALPLVKNVERVIYADNLVAARVLSGDTWAIDSVVEQIRTELKGDVRNTLATYLEIEPTIEGCARTLFVHVNTVRYRLKRVFEVTGLDPADPVDSLTLRIALMFERK